MFKNLLIFPFLISFFSYASDSLHSSIKAMEEAGINTLFHSDYQTVKTLREKTSRAALEKAQSLLDDSNPRIEEALRTLESIKHKDKSTLFAIGLIYRNLAVNISGFKRKYFAKALEYFSRCTSLPEAYLYRIEILRQGLHNGSPSLSEAIRIGQKGLSKFENLLDSESPKRFFLKDKMRSINDLREGLSIDYINTDQREKAIPLLERTPTERGRDLLARISPTHTKSTSLLSTLSELLKKKNNPDYSSEEIAEIGQKFSGIATDYLRRMKSISITKITDHKFFEVLKVLILVSRACAIRWMSEDIFFEMEKHFYKKALDTLSFLSRAHFHAQFCLNLTYFPSFRAQATKDSPYVTVEDVKSIIERRSEALNEGYLALSDAILLGLKKTDGQNLKNRFFKAFEELSDLEKIYFDGERVDLPQEGTDVLGEEKTHIGPEASDHREDNPAVIDISSGGSVKSSGKSCHPPQAHKAVIVEKADLQPTPKAKAKAKKNIGSNSSKQSVKEEPSRANRYAQKREEIFKKYDLHPTFENSRVERDFFTLTPNLQKKMDVLLSEISQCPWTCDLRRGKREVLKGLYLRKYKGAISMRITEKERLVYIVLEAKTIKILSTRGHYKR